MKPPVMMAALPFAENSYERMTKRTMTNKTLLVSTALYTAITCVSVTLAQAPVVNIDPHRHGNLAAAQSYIVQAYQKLDAAQRDNHDDLGGHAQRAKDLLTQADAEIRSAANIANSNRR
jgi:hypothetical protein